jgi:hypothetical protein
MKEAPSSGREFDATDRRAAAVVHLPRRLISHNFSPCTVYNRERFPEDASLPESAFPGSGKVSRANKVYFARDGFVHAGDRKVSGALRQATVRCQSVPARCGEPLYAVSLFPHDAASHCTLSVCSRTMRQATVRCQSVAGRSAKRKSVNALMDIPDLFDPVINF